MSCIGLDDIIRGLLDLARNNIFWEEFDSIGGPAIGAIPLIAGMMLETNIERSFFVRSETKIHGNKDLIEGNLQKGDRVLMIEDVVTTGISLLRAIKAVEEAGGIVKKVMSVLNRDQNTIAFFKEKGYDLVSLLNIAEILAVSPPGLQEITLTLEEAESIQKKLDDPTQKTYAGCDLTKLEKQCE